MALESEIFLIKAVVHKCTELALKIVNLGFEIFEVIVELSLKSYFTVVWRSNQYQIDVQKTITIRRKSELYVGKFKSLEKSPNIKIIIFDRIIFCLEIKFGSHNFMAPVKLFKDFRRVRMRSFHVIEE